MTAGSITLLAWFPNGAVSTGHPVIWLITQLACCGAIERGGVIDGGAQHNPFLTMPHIRSLGWRADPFAGVGVHTRPQDIGLL
jgi:hypothetical protein